MNLKERENLQFKGDRVKKVILLTIFIFSANFVYPGTLKFGSGQRIKSHLLNVPSHAIPIVVDYDLDKRKDLIIGDGDGYIWFYKNEDDDSPRFPIEGYKLTVNNTPIKVTSNAAPAVIDWNSDEVLDLLIGGSDGKITLFTGKDSPPQLTPVGTILTIPANNAVPFVCDWNDGEEGDNLKDLIIGDGSGNVWVYLNEGSQNNPVFKKRYQVLVGTKTLSVGNNAVPRVVQWDGEGNKDLVVGNSEGEIYVFLSGTKTTSGTPTFTIGKKIQADNKNIDVGINASPFIIDWDNDANIDLVIGEGDGSLNLFKNISNIKPPVFSISSKISGREIDLDAGSKVNPFVIDFDNDGNNDLIVGDEYGYVKLYRNEGRNDSPIFTDGYTFQVNYGTPTGIKDLDVGNNATPYVYDYNGDNNKDLIVGDSVGYIYLFINSGTDNSPIFKPGTITTGTGTNLPLRVRNNASPIVCDWNNDGLIDLIVGDKYGNVALYLNSGVIGKPIFPANPEYIKADGKNISVGNYAKPFVVDFDGDYKKDLVIGNHASDGYGYVYVYLNIGEDNSPIFTPQRFYQLQANSTPLQVSGYSAPVVVDWNEDNIYDLIVGEESGYINLYTGTIENSPPRVILETPIGTQSNNVTINYILKDDEQNPCAIVTKFSTNGGISWATATTVENAGDGVSNLNSSKDGIRHSFVWDSKKDLTGGFVGQVIIKIIPHDGKVEGSAGQTNNFIVDNKNPPKWKRIKLNGADINLDYYSTPIVVDWDEDGRQDLLIGSEDGYVYFCKNVGSDANPQFDVASQLQVEGGSPLKVNKFSAPFVYNWNNTGRDDLLVGDGNGEVTFFENTGDHLKLAVGKKIKVKTENLQVKAGNASPVAVDWNDDSYVDLIVGDRNGNLWLYLNDTTSRTLPVFLPGVKIQAESDLDVGYNATPYVIDLKKDLIIGNSDGYVFYFKNIGVSGSPSFSSGVKIKLEGEEIKVDANSKPFVLRQDGDEIDLIVGSKAGYIFSYHLTNVDMNTPPKLIITKPIGTQSIQTGSVSISYKLIDAQYNPCNIKVEFSIDQQNWYPASGTPSTNLRSSSEGIDHTFVWFSKEDLPKANNIPVWLKFTPNDGITTGSSTTVSFILDNVNNPPIVTNVITKPTGKYGQVEVSYDLQDGDNDLCKVFVMYQGGSKGNTWATATIIGTVTNIAPTTGLKLTWLSAVDEKNQSAKNYKIKITPFDIEYGTEGISTSFEINNLSISSEIVPKGSVTTLYFSPTTIELLEPFSNDFDVLITVEKNPTGIPQMDTLPSLDNTVRKITVVKLPDTNQLAPKRRAKITIPYDDLHSYETEVLLRIFELREDRWLLIGGIPHVEDNYVTAEVEHFSVFRIGLHAPTLDDFRLYPNPFKDNDGDKYNGEIGVSGYDYIAFQGVNKVEIYTIAGELIRESKDLEISNNFWKWDLRNDYGRLVGSGIYIYVVKDINGKSLVGRVGVIR